MRVNKIKLERLSVRATFFRLFHNRKELFHNILVSKQGTNSDIQTVQELQRKWSHAYSDL